MIKFGSCATCQSVEWKTVEADHSYCGFSCVTWPNLICAEFPDYENKSRLFKTGDFEVSGNLVRVTYDPLRCTTNIPPPADTNGILKLRAISDPIEFPFPKCKAAIDNIHFEDMAWNTGAVIKFDSNELPVVNYGGANINSEPFISARKTTFSGRKIAIRFDGRICLEKVDQTQGTGSFAVTSILRKFDEDCGSKRVIEIDVPSFYGYIRPYYEGCFCTPGQPRTAPLGCYNIPPAP